jgi:hypothetical protein
MEWRTQCESTMTISSVMDESTHLTTLNQASQQHSRQFKLKRACSAGGIAKATRMCGRLAKLAIHRRKT